FLQHERGEPPVAAAEVGDPLRIGREHFAETGLARESRRERPDAMHVLVDLVGIAPALVVGGGGGGGGHRPMMAWENPDARVNEAEHPSVSRVEGSSWTTSTQRSTTCGAAPTALPTWCSATGANPRTSPRRRWRAPWCAGRRSRRMPSRG